MLLSDSIDAGSPYIDGRPDPALPWLPFVACLLAGVAAAAFVAPKPQPIADPAGWTIWKALLAVLISAGTTTLVARITLPYFTCCPEEEASSLSWMSGAIGAWFAPIAVLTAQRLSLAIPAAFLCGLAAGRLLRRSSLIIADRGLADDDEPPPLFSVRSPGALTRGLAYAVAATVTLEISVVSAVGGYMPAAAILSGCGALLLAATAPTIEPPPRSGHAPARFLLQGGLALVLACLALIPLPARRAGSGLAAQGPDSAGDRPTGADLISGAILLAETRTATKVSLPPPRGRSHLAGRRATPPGTIIFSGVYWILSPPHRRPTASAKVFRDSPVTYNFTAGRHGFLTMQAHQQLPAAVDPRCCAALDVTIQSQDPMPRSIALEVVLTTSEVHPAPRQSLGVQRIDESGESVLRFPIPAHPGITSFDRIVIDFHLGGRRFNRSANVAIRSFAFIPRTL